TDVFGIAVQDVGVGVGVDLGEAEVVQAVDRPHVQVQMRDLESGHHQTDPRRAPDRLLGDADPPGDGVQVGEQPIVGVQPVVYLDPRYDQGVPVGDRPDGQERHTPIVGPDEPAGNL